jgi:pimeloyl-ACP methyl ester carboxylesterase
MATEVEIKTSVVSRDGTQIAYWTSGGGPPIVLVHGAPADHNRWRPLLSYLEPHVTVHALDRRGRGASGDAPEYLLEREYEDVAAVVDAVAASGQRVDVYGHSHGGIVAFGAAALTPNIRKLVLYEGWPVPDPSIYSLPPVVMTRMSDLLAEGDRDGVVEALFRSVEEISDEDMAALRSAPSWTGRVAAAHTVPREILGETQARLETDLAARINVPVLPLTGEQSTLKGPSRRGGRSTTRCTAVGIGRAAAYRRHLGPGDFRYAPAGVSARPDPARRTGCHRRS